MKSLGQGYDGPALFMMLHAGLPFVGHKIQDRSYEKGSEARGIFHHTTQRYMDPRGIS